MKALLGKICPACQRLDTLTLSVQLVAKEVGTFSLAGVQPKFSAVECPVLDCSACELRLIGWIEDGYAVFAPPSR